MKLHHRAVAAGLAVAIVLGSVQAPAAFAETADTVVATDGSQGASGAASTTDGASPDGASSDGASSDGASADGATLPEPSSYDKADFYQDAPVARARSLAATVPRASSLVNVTEEMRYFTLYESGKNYDQGFSYGDGYNALGYYQFDRRYSLVGVMQFCYSYDPVTFSMFKAVLDRSAELSDKGASMYDRATGRLTQIGQLAEDAWHAAYQANPDLFSRLQDTYAYNSYYAVTERWLASQGIDMSGRADCVKGLVWSLTNLFGTGGVQKYLTAADLDDAMSDREFVNAIVDSLPASLKAYNGNTQYHQSWINRYEKERATCLEYIAQDEMESGAQAGEGGTGSADEDGTSSSDDAMSGGPSSGEVDESEGGSANNGGTSTDGTPSGGGSDSETSSSAGAVTGPSTAPSNQAGANGSNAGQDAESGSDDGSGSDSGADQGGSDESGSGDTTDAGKGDAGKADGNGTSDNGASGGDEGAGNSTGASSTEGERPDAGGAANKTNESGETGAAETSGDDGQAGPGGQDADGSGDRDASGGADESAEGSMPQTGDASAIVFLAAGSIAAFGATAVKAGVIDLGRRRGESDTQ